MRRRLASKATRRLRAFVPTAIAAIGAVSALAAESDDIRETISSRVKDLFDFNRDAVVKVQSSDQHGRLEGTGFYIDPAGTIFTLLGVVGDGVDITVTQGNRRLPAKVLVTDPRIGIAILKVDANTPFIPLADSNEVEVSTPAMAIGYPMGKPVSPSFGLVAGLDKEFLNRFFRVTHIRANIPVQRGFGGAPVLDMDGHAIGVVVAGVDGNSGCYVVPINAVEKSHLDFVRFGELRPGKIGAMVAPVDSAGQKEGAKLSNVENGGPAAKAGLEDGDVVTQVGAVPITNPEDIFDASFFLTAGDATTIKVIRHGTNISVQVRPAPQNSRDLQPFDNFENNEISVAAGPEAEATPAFRLDGK